MLQDEKVSKIDVLEYIKKRKASLLKNIDKANVDSVLSSYCYGFDKGSLAELIHIESLLNSD